MRAMAKTLHTPENDSLRAILTTARNESGLTQTEVSTRLGRPQSFVAKYEGGERRLDVIEFLQVCQALDVDPCAIISRFKQEWIQKKP
jgi:transcriptional regulator with XRE-family HTH domain